MTEEAHKDLRETTVFQDAAIDIGVKPQVLKDLAWSYLNRLGLGVCFPLFSHPLSLPALPPAPLSFPFLCLVPFLVP